MVITFARTREVEQPNKDVTNIIVWRVDGKQGTGTGSPSRATFSSL